MKFAQRIILFGVVAAAISGGLFLFAHVVYSVVETFLMLVLLGIVPGTEYVVPANLMLIGYILAFFACILHFYTRPSITRPQEQQRSWFERQLTRHNRPKRRRYNTAAAKRASTVAGSAN
ncbi:hypothetical protein CR983_02480 [Candidatus Saccharibacteria bacterium]|nr:MAG: hypothetical protein CR983_02480 [Candidatus Saccharibacteria bacterium]